MENLKELAKIVSAYRLDNVAAFNIYNRKDKTSKYNQFLDGILENEFESDEDAAEAIYACGKDDIKYRVLKNRLKQRIYNNVLFIDSGKRSSATYTGIYLSLYRQLVVAKFLVGLNAKGAGFELMGKVLHRSLKYQLFDIIQQCALHYRRQSMLEGDKKKFDHYNQMFRHATETLAAESDAEEMYYLVLINFNQSFAQQPELIEVSKNSSEAIGELRSRFNTYTVNYYDNGIKSIYYQLIHDYQSAIESCNRFEKYLQENKIFYSDTRQANILVTKTSCYLHLKNFSEGIKCAEKALKLYSEGSENWFSVMELYFLLEINNNDLAKAADIYITVMSHPRFNYNRTQLREAWRIFGGYLWFLLHYYNMEEIIARLKSNRQTFRFSKLLNEIPLFSKDKKGMNVAVLILQVLLLLEKKDYVKIISRTDALKSYIYRNLGKDDAYRSHFFIKMLLAMEKAQFDSEKTQIKTKTLLTKLKQGNLSYSNTQTRMEVVPYEDLWEMALGLISNKQAIKQA